MYREGIIEIPESTRQQLLELPIDLQKILNEDIQEAVKTRIKVLQKYVNIQRTTIKKLVKEV